MDLKYLKNVLLFILGGALALLLAVYMLYHLFGGFTDEIQTYQVKPITREQVLSFDGYLFRDEQVLTASGNGEVIYLFDDGAKVAKDAKYAQVYAQSNPELAMQIREIDEELLLYEQSNEASDMTAYDSALIDKQINALYRNMQSELSAGNAEYVARKRNELLILLNKRAVIVQSVRNFDEQIEALKERKKRLSATLTEISETLRAPASGYFYSEADGYETLFTTAVLDTLTPQSFETLIGTEPVGNQGKNTVGKLVTDYHWYTVCRVENEQLRFFSANRTYSVMFPYSEDAKINMTLSRIVTNINSGVSLLVFESTVTPENFHFLRMQTVNIVRSVEEGYRVPVSAVRIVDGKSGVYVLDGNYVRFRTIDPLFESDGYLIVGKNDPDAPDSGERLSENELIITEGKDLYAGKIIRTK